MDSACLEAAAMICIAWVAFRLPRWLGPRRVAALVRVVAARSEVVVVFETRILWLVQESMSSCSAGLLRMASPVVVAVVAASIICRDYITNSLLTLLSNIVFHFDPA